MYNQKQRILNGIVALTTLITLKGCSSMPQKHDDENITEPTKNELINEVEKVNLNDLLPIKPTNLNSIKISEEEFKNLSIEEQQDYIINTYNINYIDLVNAVTLSCETNESMKKNRMNSEPTSVKLMARDDFEEIKNLFNILITAKENYIKEQNAMSDEEFNAVFSLVAAFGVENYAEGYSTMNLIDNLRYSSATPSNISWYFIISQPNAFSIDINREQFYNNKEKCPSYYGGLDFAIYQKRVHYFIHVVFPVVDKNKNYINPGVQLFEGGNVYSRELKPEEIAVIKQNEVSKRELKR